MSSYPSPPQSYPPTRYQPPPTNGLGLAGFIISLTGLIMCFGILSPIGLIFSLIGLGKEPRGFAIAGTVIGLLGSLVAATFILAIAGFINIGLPMFQYFNGQFQTTMQMDSAQYDIDNYYSSNNNTLPDASTGSALIAGYFDNWGTPIEYRPLQGATTDYELLSAGPDMQMGTSDDIVRQYTTFGFASPQFNNPAFPQDEPGEEQVDFAFNAAAEHLSAAFPPNSPMPDAATGNDKITSFIDPWNGQLRYAPSSASLYHLKSAGPDGQWQTDDDITRSFFFEPSGTP